tara:strand:+ start:821 stop:1987 length:1167 start_codon:yes stop_codon:yes gene_type:complete
MDLELNEQQSAILNSVRSVVNRFDDDYWLQLDRNGEFPHAFYQAMAEGGWLGVAMPEDVGGSDLGIFEAALIMITVADSPGAMAAASSIHINIFGPHPIVVFGNDEQKQAWLPDLIQGRSKCCFGVTEPDSGLETGSIQTFAESTDNGYVVNGQKIWTSTAQHADKIMLLARTTPREQCTKSTDGLSLFFTDLDTDYVDVREIPKMGRAAVDSNMVFIDSLPVPREHLIGEPGRGFEYILHGLNPERILVGVEALGIGWQALGRAVRYARERVVFDRPIGQNQAIQHPLAENWMELQAGLLVCMEAARRYDAGKPCGALANTAKYLSAEAGYKAATQALMTYGGMGYAKEYHVERLLREAMIPRLAPVSAQLILCYIAERVLDLPRSY